MRLLIGPDRFLREIVTAAQLTHPHILTVHDSVEAGTSSTMSCLTSTASRSGTGSISGWATHSQAGAGRPMPSWCSFWESHLLEQCHISRIATDRCTCAHVHPQVRHQDSGIGHSIEVGRVNVVVPRLCDRRGGQRESWATGLTMLAAAERTRRRLIV